MRRSLYASYEPWEPEWIDRAEYFRNIGECKDVPKGICRNGPVGAADILLEWP